MLEASLSIARYQSMLATLAEQGLHLATEAYDRACEAETPEDKSRSLAHWRQTARALRQTIALAARLQRDQRRAEAEERKEAVQAEQARLTRRQQQVRAAVERRIDAEFDEDQAQALTFELEDRLAEEALYDRFGAEPLEVHITRLCREFGVTPPEPEVEPAPAPEPLPAALSAQPTLRHAPEPTPRLSAPFPDHPFQSSG